jgi:hypothetical protein
MSDRAGLWYWDWDQRALLGPWADPPLAPFGEAVLGKPWGNEGQIYTWEDARDWGDYMRRTTDRWR